MALRRVHKEAAGVVLSGCCAYRGTRINVTMLFGSRTGAGGGSG